MLSELGQAVDLLGDRRLEVVSGDRLVEAEDVGLVPGPDLGPVGVHVVRAGARSVRRGLPVVGEHALRRFVQRDRTDHHLRPRRGAEPIRHDEGRPRVGLLRQLHDLARPAEIHLRVRSQPLLNLLQVGGAEDFLSKGPQFVVDPLQLRQTPRMNLGRRQVERREVVDHRLVAGGAARQTGESDPRARARVRIEFVAQEVAESHVRRSNALGGGLADAGPEIVPRPLGPRIEPRARRSVDGPFLHGSFEEGVELHDRPVHRRARRDASRLEAGAKVRDVVVDIVGERVPATDHALAVDRRFERLGAHDVEEVELKPFPVVHDPHLEIARLLGDFRRKLMVEREIGQPVPGRQRGEVDGAEGIGEGTNLAAAIVAPGRRDVADAVAEAVLSQIGRLQRVPGKVGVPEAVAERRKVAGRGRVRRFGRPRLAGRDRARHENQDRDPACCSVRTFAPAAG